MWQATLYEFMFRALSLVTDPPALANRRSRRVLSMGGVHVD